MTATHPTAEYYEAVSGALDFQIERVLYRVHRILYALHIAYGWRWAFWMYHDKLSETRRRLTAKYLDGFERRDGDEQYLLWLLRKDK